MSKKMEEYDPDSTSAEVIDSISKELDNKRKVKRMNKLQGMRVYLAGPIDDASDDGVGWRLDLKPWLEERGIFVLDPCDKPIAYSAYKEIEGEKQKMMELKRSGRFYELAQQMRDIVHVDLRMVDVSDVVIVYLNTNVSMCGTYHELINALQPRKPTLVVIEGAKKEAPNWLFGIMNFNFMFDDFDALKLFLQQIDEEIIAADLSRWVFFDRK
jgi:nucleoside 2-deoxyribosyltransferase